jgi:hypothetical protein
VFTIKTFSINSYQGLVVFLSQNQKEKKKTNWSLSLAKPLKFLKPKPPLQNQPSTELQAVVFFCPKPFHSNQRAMIDQSLIEYNEKPLQNPLNDP